MREYTKSCQDKLCKPSASLYDNKFMSINASYHLVIPSGIKPAPDIFKCC